MFWLILPIAVSITVIVLYVVIAAFLIRKYLRTRDIGFVWLGIAVVVWPWLIRWSYYALWRHYFHLPHAGLYSRIWVFGVETSLAPMLQSLDSVGRLVGLALILISVLCLSRSKISPSTED